MRVTFTLYSKTTGDPLPSQVVGILSLTRVNPDDTVTNLPLPSVSAIDNVSAPGDYYFTVPDNEILPGSVLHYVIDAGLNASSRFYDGEITPSSSSGGGSSSTPVPVSLIIGSGSQVFMGQDDRNPSLAYQLVGTDGAPVNLTACTVAFNMVNAKTGVAKISNRACTLVDAVNGKVLMAWLAGDTDTPADYLASFVVTDGSGLKSTYPAGTNVVVRVVKKLV